MFCPLCHTEYRPGFDRCADCCVDLVETLPERPQTDASQEIYQGEWVTVANLTSKSDVALLKAMLDSESIPFTVQNDGPAFVLVGTAVPTSFQVPQDERDRAVEMVEQLAQGYQPADQDDQDDQDEPDG
jgi:hypothetical protein